MKKYIVSCLLINILAFEALAINQALLIKLLEAKRESYLSRQGEINLDLVPYYSQDESIVPWTDTKYSSYGLSLNLRLGLTNRLEATLRVPYAANYKKIYTSKWDTYKISGFGDPSFSLQYELAAESYERPSLYLLLGATPPLTRSSFDNLQAAELPLGSGCFSYDLGISFLKSLDPVVVSAGVDYILNLRRGSYDPADQIAYNGSVNISLNQQVGLSLGLSGAYVGEEQDSSAYNRAGLSLGSTFILVPDLILNPNIFIGLTKEETDFSFSFGLTRKLKEANI